MAIHIRRREFIATLGSTAVAWRLAARAQQTAMPVIGLLSSISADVLPLAALSPRPSGTRLRREPQCGYRIQFAEGQYDRLPALASELVEKEGEECFSSKDV
jgi:putative ABC transport system substrate-binding protein